MNPCPICGKKHRSLDVARKCITPVTNQYAFWIIAHQAGDRTKPIEDKFTGAPLQHYLEDKAAFDKVEAYEERFRNEG